MSNTVRQKGVPKSPLKERIRHAFLLSGHTYRELGEVIGCSRQSAHNKLNGSQPLTSREIDALERFLKISVQVEPSAAAAEG